MAVLVIVNLFEKDRKKTPRQIEKLRWGKAWQ